VRRQFLMAWWILLLGCLVRETTLLFMPVLAYVQHVSSHLRKWTAFVSLALLGFFLFFLWYSGSTDSLHFNLTTRLTGWTKNFSDYRHVSETLILPVLVLGWPSIVYLRNRKDITQQYPYLSRMVIPFVIANTLIVWTMATAREARLYFLPVLLMLPLIIPYLGVEVKRMWKTLIDDTRVAMISLFGAAIIAMILYQPTIGNTGILFKTYAFWYLTGCILMLFTHQKERPMTTATGLP